MYTRIYETDAVSSIRNALSQTDSEISNVFDRTLDRLNPERGASIDSSIRRITDALRNYGERVSTLVGDVLHGKSEAFYRASKELEAKKFGFVASFVRPDEVAIERINSFQHLFIGKHYKDNVTARAKKIVLDTIVENRGTLSRREIATALKSKMNDVIKQTPYWETVASQLLNNARSYSSLNLYREAEILEFEVSSVLDERTSEVCRIMDGAVFSVPVALSNLARYDEVRSIDDVKQIVPWLSSSADGLTLNGRLLGRAVSGRDLQALGVNAPPYHARCRSTVLGVVCK